MNIILVKLLCISILLIIGINSRNIVEKHYVWLNTCLVVEVLKPALCPALIVEPSELIIYAVIYISVAGVELLTVIAA